MSQKFVEISVNSIIFREEGKPHGILTVTAEELSEGRQESIYFVVTATDLDRKDFLGKCDPFLKIYRINEDNTLVNFKHFNY